MSKSKRKEQGERRTRTEKHLARKRFIGPDDLWEGRRKEARIIPMCLAQTTGYLTKLFTSMATVETGKQIDIMSLFSEYLVKSLSVTQCKLPVQLDLQLQTTKKRLVLERQIQIQIQVHVGINNRKMIDIVQKKKVNRIIKRNSLPKNCNAFVSVVIFMFIIS